MEITVEKLKEETDLINSKIVNVIKETEIMKKEKPNRLITKEGWDLSVLNPLELKYFRLMYPKSGVLYLTSEPGLAKTQIFRSIAKKLKWLYLDIRLSMRDETDVGLYPDKIELDCKVMVDGEVQWKKEKLLDHIVPRWAYKANLGPCLIHFEELNRAPLAVRNAALQILLEREIGDHFKFNEDVFMVSTGNLGEEDGTDVEEFDSALNSRLIHYRHRLPMDLWFEYYANENIHPSIIKYLTAHPDHYYLSKLSRSEKDKAFACPRTWTFLSDYITANFGENADVTDWIHDITNIGHAHIGSVMTSFLRYLNDSIKIGINDILDRYALLKQEDIKLNRDKKSELLTELKALDISKMNELQIENIKLFILDVGEDEVASILLKLLDEDYKFVDDKETDQKTNSFIFSFFKDPRFKKYECVLLNYVQKSNAPKKDDDKKDDDFWEDADKSSV